MSIIQPTSLIPIKVSATWATPANAYRDITSALYESFPGVFSFPLGSALTLVLLQVQSNRTYKAVVVLNVNGTATVSTPFAVQPAIDSFVYVTDVE